MADQLYEPGPGNSPFGNPNVNPVGANYATDSGYSPEVTKLIQAEIKRVIFDTAPKQYMSLKILFSKKIEDRNLDEHSYFEKTFGRSIGVANAISAAVVAVPGADVTQTITFTAASVTRFSKDLILIYPDNSKAVIVNVVGNDVTVNSLTSEGLPAVAVGEVFATQSSITADARDHFNVYSRMETVERYNYIQFFNRACRWGRVERQKYLNAGTTDYLERDKKEKTEQLRVDMYNSAWNGTRGEFQLEDLTLAKTMGGIYPTMDAAGSARASVAKPGFKAAFEALCFATNHKAVGETRFIHGTDESLQIFADIYKNQITRFAPNDTMANLNLDAIKIGTMNYVMVPNPLFSEESCFPSDWGKRIFVLDQETITPVKMKGIPFLESGQTDNLAKGSRENFTDW